jgi:hypothetical protein
VTCLLDYVGEITIQHQGTEHQLPIRITVNPPFSQNNELIGKLDTVQKLTDWNESEQIDGESVGEIQLIEYLTEWNSAR